MFFCIILSEESKVQLEFWQENIKHLNCKRIISVHSFSKIIFSDASSTGFAGYQVAVLNGVSHGMWAPDEVLKVALGENFQQFTGFYIRSQSRCVIVK